MKALFETLVAYNAWANERLYGAVATLPDAQYRSDQGAFFGSRHGTLNHTPIGDRIWMHVFTKEGVKPTQLDAVLHDESDELRAARRAEDAAPSLDLIIFRRQTRIGLTNGKGGDFTEPERRPTRT